VLIQQGQEEVLLFEQEQGQEEGGLQVLRLATIDN
jgi:hypothetical protein